MPQAYRALIFDWDGTLADSTAQIVAGVEAAYRLNQLAPPRAEDIHHIIGLSLVDAMHHLSPELSKSEVAQIAEAYRHHHSLNPSPTVLFPEAQTWLPILAEHYWLAVATGKSRAGLNQSLIDTHTQALFLETRTVDECAAKPQPEMIHSICDTLGLRPQEVLMIGDTTHDLNMAYNAGADAIAVTTGAHDIAKLQTVPHLAMLNNIAELAAWLGISPP